MRMGLGATPALVAMGIAMGVTALVWVPASILLLRRRGRFGWGTASLSFAALLYACGLLAYTLFPTGACYPPLSAQLVPGAFVPDVLDAGGVALSNPALRQVLLNVLLFVPFGMLVRRRGRPGVALTTALGAAASVLVELTQLTGTFGLAACQYRLLDVDDVLLNGAGALVGALAAPLVWRLPGQPDARLRALPRPLTAWRRLGAMAIDVGVSIGVGGAVMVLGIGGVGVVAILSSGVGTGTVTGTAGEAPVALVGAIAAVVGASGGLAAAVVHLLVVLRTGRTVGELAGWLDARLETGERAGAGRRVGRWALGIGGWTLASTFAFDPATQTLVAGWAIAAIVLAFRSRAHSGLALRLTQQVARDVRDPR
ncbi:hypothetical protein GCM10009846_06290 [Agrococcus versicolor]|uniref:VanZ-like domain-containing protein n=1 Tax=Agrococcus versicolor TaxID=501482 RepID=A0ABP5MB91_9MICO